MKLKYLAKTLKKKGRNDHNLHAFWNQVIITTNIKNWFKQLIISHPHESINSRCTYWTLSIHPSEISIYIYIFIYLFILFLKKLSLSHSRFFYKLISLWNHWIPWKNMSPTP
jgi:hypothetical protein